MYSSTVLAQKAAFAAQSLFVVFAGKLPVATVVKVCAFTGIVSLDSHSYRGAGNAVVWNIRAAALDILAVSAANQTRQHSAVIDFRSGGGVAVPFLW